MRWYIPIGFVVLLAACQGPDDTSKAVAACYQSVTTANNLATTALQQDQITIEEACNVSVWGKLARASCDASLENWVRGDPQTAQDHLSAAQGFLNGVSAEAVTIANYTCGE